MADSEAAVQGATATEEVAGTIIVMTLMVRDEVDIVGAMIEHHLAQGVDLIVVTDNGSVDGTRELLEKYVGTGRVEVHDDFEHRKQQSSVVSRMASRAYVEHGADWVINADADEFFVPVNRSMTLRDVLEKLPNDLGSFTARVVNMTGAPGGVGSGLTRLRWRDERAEETLMETSGLHAQPTANAIHVGLADIVVSQGNHFVSAPSNGEPEPGMEIEVLHYPWRSWTQFRTKVENTGRAYRSNPDRTPSPRHHGMRDFRMLEAGLLEDFYLYRHPPQEVVDGQVFSSDFVHDEWLLHELRRLVDKGLAHQPQMLADMLDVDGGSEYDSDTRQRAAERVRLVLPLEVERTDSLHAAVEARKQTHRVYKKTLASLTSARGARDSARDELAAVRAERDRLAAEVAGLRQQSGALRADRDRRVQELKRVRGSRNFRLGKTLLDPVRWVSKLVGHR